MRRVGGEGPERPLVRDFYLIRAADPRVVLLAIAFYNERRKRDPRMCPWELASNNTRGHWRTAARQAMIALLEYEAMLPQTLTTTPQHTLSDLIVSAREHLVKEKADGQRPPRAA